MNGMDLLATKTANRSITHENDLSSESIMLSEDSQEEIDIGSIDIILSEEGAEAHELRSSCSSQRGKVAPMQVDQQVECINQSTDIAHIVYCCIEYVSF